MNKNATHPALEPAIFIIFGITGDLSQRKLLPALYHLVKDGLLHEHTAIVGVTRREVGAQELLDQTRLCIAEEDGKCDPTVLQKMHDMLRMVRMDLTDGAAYDELRKRLDGLEDQHGLCMNRLFYLSIPPQVYGPIIRLLGEHGLNQSCKHGKAASRLLVEKPFGYDLTSATELIETTMAAFQEDHVYRIDHYIAKETVQNIVTFRMSNPVFNSLWGGEHIQTIQITAHEKIDIEGRVTFYEETGALRDFVQSHLLQLLGLIIMDVPADRSPEGLHAARLAALQQVVPITPSEVEAQAVRAQYEQYRRSVNNEHSTTETYAALLLRLSGARWQDVPVLIRTGKALHEKRTEIAIIFGAKNAPAPSNVLRFRIQPDEGIGLSIEVKRPGFEYQAQEAVMDFTYANAFNEHGHPDAYERVLVDAVRGDRTLFTTSEEVLAAWHILEPVVQSWAQSPAVLPRYAMGSAGPTEADTLAKSAGLTWL